MTDRAPARLPRESGDPDEEATASFTRRGSRFRGNDEGRDHRLVAFGIAALVFVADQFVKWLVVSPLNLKAVRQIEILPIFNLTWVENYGVSLGLLTANDDTSRWLLVALTAAISAGVAVWIWRERLRADALALGLVLGGALGNIVDRVRFGYVVDYADLHFGSFQPFLVFNVADAAITIGVLLLLVRALLTRDTKGAKAPKDEASEHA